MIVPIGSHANQTKKEKNNHKTCENLKFGKNKTSSVEIVDKYLPEKFGLDHAEVFDKP